MKRLILILGLLTSFVYAQSKAGFYVVGGQLITVQDTSSRKYLKAVENAGVVPSVLQNMASNFLVTTERAIGSYSLMSAQYPFIGGTAATHKFNLNDPRDLDAAFRLVFVGGTWTHSSIGAKPSGVSTYANTFVPQNFNTNYNMSFGYYSTENINNLSSINIEMGVRLNTYSHSNEASLAIQLSTNTSGAANLSFFNSNQNDNVVTFTNNVSSKGFFLGSNTNLNLIYLANNSIYRATATATTQTPISQPFWLFNMNQSGASPQFGTNRACGYSYISKDLTELQLIQQSQIVTFFNSIQGRQ